MLSREAPAAEDAGQSPAQASGQTSQKVSAIKSVPDEAARSGGIVYMTKPLERDAALEGITYKIKWPASAHALYVTINDIVRDGRRRPFEIFINTKNLEHYAWTVALTRMISAVFRRGGDVAFVAEELKAVFDPEGGRWMEGRYVPSLLAAIGDVIEEHMLRTGFLTPEGSGRPIRMTSNESPLRSRSAPGSDETIIKLQRPQTANLCHAPRRLPERGFARGAASALFAASKAAGRAPAAPIRAAARFRRRHVTTAHTCHHLALDGRSSLAIEWEVIEQIVTAR